MKRKRTAKRRTSSCKYVASYSRKSDAEAHVKDLRRDGYKARVKVVKGTWTVEHERGARYETYTPGRVEVLSCGLKKRRR